MEKFRERERERLTQNLHISIWTNDSSLNRLSSTIRNSIVQIARSSLRAQTRDFHESPCDSVYVSLRSVFVFSSADATVFTLRIENAFETVRRGERNLENRAALTSTSVFRGMKKVGRAIKTPKKKSAFVRSGYPRWLWKQRACLNFTCKILFLPSLFFFLFSKISKFGFVVCSVFVSS